MSRASISAKAILTLVSVFAGAPGLAQSPQPNIESLELMAVETWSGDRAVERGLLVTPYFHDRPDSDVFRLPFLRFRSDAEDPGPPMFLLAGGPGSSYLDDLEDEDFISWLDGFLEIGDVVVLEQRGANTAGVDRAAIPAVLSCTIRADISPGLPLTPKVYQAVLADNFAECASRYRSEGVPLEAYTIVQMAADFHRLRDALGYERFNIMGGSFGSQLGFTIIRMDEAGVHRAIFYGVEGPGDTIDRLEYVDGHIDRVAAALDHNWQMRLIAGDFRGALTDLITRLETHPLRGTVKVEGEPVDIAVGSFDLKLMLWSREGIKGYRGNIARIGRLLTVTALGREEFLLQAKANLVGRLGGKDGLRLNLMTFLVDCSSLPLNDRAFPASDPNKLFGPEIVDSELRSVCASLDLPVIEAGNFIPVRADTPVVLVAGGLDGFTPPEYARQVLSGLSNGYLIEVPLGDHNGWAALESDPAYQRAALDFLSGEGRADALPPQIDLPRLRVELVPTWIIPAAGVSLVLFIGLGWTGLRRMRRAGRSRRSEQSRP